MRPSHNNTTFDSCPHRKTETVKICLNHIASVQRGRSSFGNDDPVVQRVVESNPLLEAFGNAQTRRNDNSSRFGKYLQLQFSSPPAIESAAGAVAAQCNLVGSKCDVYLLEKNRVVRHVTDERTFHIFYQLLATDDEVKTQFWEGLRGKRNESFRFVGSTKTRVIEGVHDKDKFNETLQALALVGVKDALLTTLMQALCIVLQLGNLNFTALRGDTDKSEVANMKDLKLLSDLMGVSSEHLNLSLTERTFVTDKESYKVNLNQEAAEEARDALAKEVYQKTFLWLVQTINQATCADESNGQPISTIGLLDIFGFEHFPHNTFEQLCINYANEKLQQKFNEDIFRNVQAEYKAEGIVLTEIEYEDNTCVLDLIEGRTGLLNLLNEECIRPKGNDLDFVHKSLRINSASPALVVHKTDRMSFGIKHYAGTVIYDAEFFVQKNLDTLPTDLQACIESSSNNIINTARSEPVQTAKPTNARFGGGGRKKESNITAPTVWSKYKNQLSTLMTNLRQTKSRYIRCIKPNTQKKPLIMEHRTTVEQLRCAGVIAGITIARSAFPNRLANSIVLARYAHMWDSAKYPSKKTKDMTLAEKNKCDCEANMQCALASLATTDKDGNIVPVFVVGKTKTFFRSGALEFLESGRMSGLDDQVTLIQKYARGWLARNGGRRDREKEEMEEALRQAALKAEEEKRAQRARERAAYVAERQKVLDNLASQVSMLEKSCTEFGNKQDQKVKELTDKNASAQRELDQLKQRCNDEYEEEARKRMIERAQQEQILEANAKVITKLKKENKKIRKENGKILPKHTLESGRNDQLEKTKESLLRDLDETETETDRLEEEQELYSCYINKLKEDNAELGEMLTSWQGKYLEQANRRLGLQRAAATAVSASHKTKKRALIEEVQDRAYSAEAESKSIMAQLDIESLQPDLTFSNLTNGDRETMGPNFEKLVLASDHVM